MAFFRTSVESDTYISTEVGALQEVEYNRYIEYYIDNRYDGKDYIYAGDPNTSNLIWRHTFGNLRPATGYKLQCKIFRSDDNSYLWGDTLWPATASIVPTIDSLSSESGYRKPTFNAYARVDDHGCGCSVIYATLYDGSTALHRTQVAYTGAKMYTFTFNAPSTYKTYTIKVYAENRLGKGNSISIPVNVGHDQTPPIPSPPGYSISGVTNSKTFRVYSNIENSGVGILSVYFSLFDGNKQIQGGQGVHESGNTYAIFFNTPPQLKDYKIVVSARNMHDYVSTDIINYITIGLDNVAPTIASVNVAMTPEGNLLASMRAYDTNGMSEAHFAISAANAVDIYKNTIVKTLKPDQEYSENIFTADCNGVSFKNGATYRVLFNAKDKAGNLASAVYDIHYSGARPPKWYWSEKALNAFNNKGLTDQLTIDEWNRFVDSTIQVCEWYQQGYSNGLETCKLHNGDRVLTASRFNMIRNKIGSMYSTGIHDKAKGDPVLGNYFITLQNSLNSVTSPFPRLHYETMFFKIDKTKDYEKMFDYLSNDKEG